MSITKQEIIEAIRRTAKENGDKPLGQLRFEKETSIKPYDWGKHWARFGDAQKEAGFDPNTLKIAYDAPNRGSLPFQIWPLLQNWKNQ